MSFTKIKFNDIKLYTQFVDVNEVSEVVLDLSNAFDELSNAIDDSINNIDTFLSNLILSGNIMQISNEILSSNKYSFAFGENNIVGGMGYEIISGKKEDVVINGISYTDAHFYVIKTHERNPIDSFISSHILSSDLKYSIVAQNRGTNAGKIISVDYDNNTIIAEVDENLFYPITDLNSITELSSKFMYFVEYPYLGNCIATTGSWSGTEGSNNKQFGSCGHVEGYYNIAAGTYAHAEGKQTIASWGAHAEGTETEALGQCSHSEGKLNRAYGYYSHVEGIGNDAFGKFSHAAGINSFAKDSGSYVWQGSNNNYANVGIFTRTAITDYRYESHGNGTYNINPVKGLNGFYVGEYNIGKLFAQNLARSGKCTVITVTIDPYTEGTPNKGDVYIYIQKTKDDDFVEIDWGDGSEIELVFDNSDEIELKHHYRPGSYVIVIDDTITKIGFIKYGSDNKMKDYIKTSKNYIYSFNSYATKLTDVFDRCFQQAQNIQDIIFKSYAGATNLSYFMYNTNNLSCVHMPYAQKLYGNALCNNMALKSAYFPNVQTLGSYAFKNSKIEKLKFDNLTSIGAQVFAECNSLTEIDLRNCKNKVTINNTAFNMQYPNLSVFVGSEDLKAKYDADPNCSNIHGHFYV